MVKSAYLRVYEPEDSVTVSVDRLPVAAHISEDVTWSEYGLIDEPLREDVLAADWKGHRYLCPRRPKLRMLEGVLAFHNAFIGGEVLVPETIAATAAAELQQLKDREPEQRSHILTSPWHVPLRWFVAFAPADREIVQDDDRISIRYRTDRRTASKRLAKALKILEQVGMDDGVVENVRDFSDWIANFSSSSLVELDYGSVAELFEGSQLVFDESAAEVWESLVALGAKDWERSARMYNEVSGRWSHAASVTQLN
ncbi:MAG: hypothetical protein OEY55_04850 [Acidimicrobiia bacterium]|nr:hypothetical protein [Acidimicrobiia bacterium]MDH5504798.1 hypothetical protein [Acidimicrobiia bacterium]